MSVPPNPCWVVAWYDAENDKWTLRACADETAARKFVTRCDRDGIPHKAPSPYPAAGVARSVGAAAVGEIIGPNDISVVHTAQMVKPTLVLYGALQRVHEHFNRVLLGGRLPNCMITLGRKGKAQGTFISKAYISLTGEEQRTDEIMLNPRSFRIQSPREICQTVVHEMIHQAQFHFGKPMRNGYHDRQWGNAMKEIGLWPSSTGKPGGRETGVHMADYVIEGGPFALAFEQLDTTIEWGDATREKEGPAAKPKRVKICCPVCDFGIQAVPSAVGQLACIPCGNVPMVAAG